MIKKRFISMLVLLAAVATGAVATTVTWVTTDFYNTSPDTFTKYDVTVTTTNQARMSNYFYGDGVNTFTTTLGNFTKIEIVFMPESSPLNISGWDYEVIEVVQPDPEEMPDIWEYTSKLTWTGDAESVSIQGSIQFIKSITFTIAEPVTGYGVSLKEDTEDATSWQGKAGEGEYQELPLEGVAAGTAVSVKYSGTKKVKSVKAVKKAAAVPEYYNKLTKINDNWEEQEFLLKQLGRGRQAYNSSLTAAQAYALATYQAAIDGKPVYVIMSSQDGGYEIHYALSTDASATEHTADLYNICNESNPPVRMYYVAQ